MHQKLLAPTGIKGLRILHPKFNEDVGEDEDAGEEYEDDDKLQTFKFQLQNTAYCGYRHSTTENRHLLGRDLLL